MTASLPLVNAIYRERVALERTTNRITWPDTRYIKNPVGFCKDILGYAPTAVQRRALEMLVTHNRIVWKSGRRCGKSRFLASAALWWFATHARCKVVLGAPCERQISMITYNDLQTLWRNSGVCLRCRTRNPYFIGPCEHSTPLDGRLSPTVRTGLVADNRVIFGIAPKSGDGAKGIASENLLTLLDEAPTIHNDIFNAHRDNHASGGCMIVTGNPSTRTTWFFDVATRDSSFVSMSASCIDQPNVKLGRVVYPGLVEHTWVEERRRTYGEEDPRWQSEILGEFPSIDSNQLINDEDLAEANMRWEAGSDDAAQGELVVGIDPAGNDDVEVKVSKRAGDLIGMCVMRGRRVLKIWGFRGVNHTIIRELDEVMRTYQRYATEPIRVQYDASSHFGSSLRDALYDFTRDKPHVRYQGLISRGARDEPVLRNHNVRWFRDAYWINLAHRIKADDLEVPFEPKLHEELLTCVRKLDGERTAVSKQEDFRALLGRSPDKSNALMYAAWDGDIFQIRDSAQPQPEAPKPADLTFPAMSAIDRADAFARSSWDRLNRVGY